MGVTNAVRLLPVASGETQIAGQDARASRPPKPTQLPSF